MLKKLQSKKPSGAMKTLMLSGTKHVVPLPFLFNSQETLFHLMKTLEPVVASGGQTRLIRSLTSISASHHSPYPLLDSLRPDERLKINSVGFCKRFKPNVISTENGQIHFLSEEGFCSFFFWKRSEA